MIIGVENKLNSSSLHIEISWRMGVECILHVLVEVEAQYKYILHNCIVFFVIA